MTSADDPKRVEASFATCPMCGQVRQTRYDAERVQWMLACDCMTVGEQPGGARAEADERAEQVTKMLAIEARYRAELDAAQSQCAEEQRAANEAELECERLRALLARLVALHDDRGKPWTTAERLEFATRYGDTWREARDALASGKRGGEWVGTGEGERRMGDGVEGLCPRKAWCPETDPAAH